MKRTLTVILALIAIAVVAIVVWCNRALTAPSLSVDLSSEQRTHRPTGQGRKDSTRGHPVSPRLAPSSSRAKAALIALFAVKPGEMPPELPELTRAERHEIPMIIENELTDADGCDAEKVRRVFRHYMEMGGVHTDFLPAYRRMLLNEVRH